MQFLIWVVFISVRLKKPPVQRGLLDCTRDATQDVWDGTQRATTTDRGARKRAKRSCQNGSQEERLDSASCTPQLRCSTPPYPAAPTGTKTYILRSILDPALIELAAKQDEDILVLEQDENGANDDTEDVSPSTGAIFSWQSSDQLGSIGLLYVILSLILVNGKAILDSEPICR